jgi:hypothetical protein
MGDAFAAATLPRPAAFGGYRSPSRRARWTLVLLGATIALDMASLLALGAERSLLNRGVGQITLGEWHNASSRVSVLAEIELVLLVVTAIVFLRWLHRCYANLRALGITGGRFTPGWAVGYWFVPILNLVRPKQILDDLWRATDGGSEAVRDGGWRTLPTTSATSVWLGLWIAGGVVGRIAARNDLNTFSDLVAQNSWLLLASALQLGAAVCMYRLVRSLTERQEAQASALRSAA